MPGDNRQDFAVEVLAALPVLIVDGEISAAAGPRRNTDFLRDALSPARDQNPVVKARRGRPARLRAGRCCRPTAGRAC